MEEHPRKRPLNHPQATQQNLQGTRPLAQCFGLTPHSTQRSETSPDDMDLLLAKEMNRLTMDEREQVYEDIHGIARSAPETPDLISQKIEELNDAILKRSHKDALEMAQFLNPDHVQSLKVAFLRASSFDVTRTAQRLIDFFEAKLDLFGLSKLAKDLEFDDLNQDDQEALLSGCTQCSKDHNGRLVWMSFGNHFRKEKHWKNQVSSGWLMIWLLWLMSDGHALTLAHTPILL